MNLSPSTGIQVGRPLTVSVKERQRRSLLRTQLDAVGGPLTGQKFPDQLNLTVLHSKKGKPIFKIFVF